jgi:hypothetical protein
VGPCPEAYASESVFIIEVFEDPGMTLTRTFASDYAAFDDAASDYEDDAVGFVPRSCLVNKNSSNSSTVQSSNGVEMDLVEDSFWGVSKVKAGVYTRFEAEMELKKARDHLAVGRCRLTLSAETEI